MDFILFYEWKRIFQKHDIAGLFDQLLFPKHQFNATLPEFEAQVLEAHLEYPNLGCIKLSDHLNMQGILISSLNRDYRDSGFKPVPPIANFLKLRTEPCYNNRNRALIEHNILSI